MKKRIVSDQHAYGMLLIGIVCGLLCGYVIMGTGRAIFSSSSASEIRQPREILHVEQKQEQGFKGNGHTIHTIITSDGRPYQNVQGRIMYGTYQLVQKMPGGEHLTGFTRILHRTTEDELMNEIPTFRANPLHPQCDVWCDFPVADRPNAVQQWIDATKAKPSLLQGEWIFLAECDYVWMKPLPAPDANNPAAPGLQYMFGYIMPQHPTCINIIRRLAGRENVDDVPPSGPAPALLRYTDLIKITPEWERLTAAIEADNEAKNQLGWVREMYAWDIAVTTAGINMITQSSKNAPWSVTIYQPPNDLVIGNASLAHYTWATEYHEGNKNGKLVWKFEKREWQDPRMVLKVPRIQEPPGEWKEGWTLQDDLPITRELHQTTYDFIHQMNRAIDQLKDLSAS